MGLSKDEAMFLDKVSSRLVELRREQNLSQEKLAEKSGVERIVIASLETSARRPTVTTIYRLSKGLGIKVEDFFKGVQ